MNPFNALCSIYSFFWFIALSGYGIGIVMVSFIFYFSHAIDEQDNVKRNIWKLNLKSVFRAFRLVWDAMICKNTKPWKDNFLSSKLILILILQAFNVGFLLWGAIVRPGMCDTIKRILNGLFLRYIFLLALYLCRQFDDLHNLLRVNENPP